MKKVVTLAIAVLFFTAQGNAQVYTDKVVGQKHQVLKDSLKASEYPYALPIRGQGVGNGI